MLIKQADDKADDLRILEGLLAHPAAKSGVKRKIEQEIRFIQSGAKGEKDAAFEIDFHYGPSQDWAVIHDLRLEHGGRIAQIDHLLINRHVHLWVCESKRFGEGIAINEHGECSAFYAGKPFGVPSPFEQNRKHCAVLATLLDDGAVQLPSRLGFLVEPAIMSLVLVSTNALITRPKAKIEGLDDIVKADQVKTRIDRAYLGDKATVPTVKLIASENLEEFARRLAALHRPASMDWHARFGLPRPVGEPVVATDSALAQSHEPALPAPDQDSEKKSKLTCCACGKTVSYSVAKFCWFNKPRFGGKVYCMDCQKTVPAAG